MKVFGAMAIDGTGWRVALRDAWPRGMLNGRRCYVEAMQSHDGNGEHGVGRPVRSDRRKRPLVGRVAAGPTVGLLVLEQLRSCLVPARGWCANRCGARKDIDDDHRRAAVPADEGGSRFDDGFVG